MNKELLIKELATEIGMTQKDVKPIIDLAFEKIKVAVANGDRVSITDFGIFEKIVRPSRIGRNPRTGETIQLNETSNVKFKASKNFKNIVSV